MKHVKSLSNEKPMLAQEPAFLTLGNFLKLWPGPVLSSLALIGGIGNDAFGFIARILDDLLQT